MTAEKTSKTVSPQHSQADHSFFRKAEEPAFFGAQQSAGFFGSFIQTKLSVSEPGDAQEKEADSVADQVMRMSDEAPVSASGAQEQNKQDEGLMRLPDPAPQEITAPTDESQDQLQRQEEEKQEETPVQARLMRKCTECEKEDKVQTKLMRKAAPMAASGISTIVPALSAPSSSRLQTRAHSPPSITQIHREGRAPPVPTRNFESRLQNTKGAGSALPDSTRAIMEGRIGADFSGVRIHTGPQAETLSRDIQAQAFTHGGDIYFNSGKYSPHSADGQHLLAHELTHTIQQGASPGVSRTVQRRTFARADRRANSFIQRVASSRPVPSQLNQAVAKAKAEEGKVNANKEGPDGFRTGSDRLIEYFKTSLGPDKVIGAGGSYVKGAVAEQDIKKKREITGALVPAHPAVERKGPYKRDAMPSWCGIFVFWALHKGGVPMKPWGLGGQNVKPDAAYPPGYTPQAGDIAYRNDFSHFAIVEKASGDTITTVNGNTAGEDNLGGQIQTRDHPRSGWTAFFDPLMLKDGPLSSGETNAENAKPLGIKELRKKLFHVDRQANSKVTSAGTAPTQATQIQKRETAKPDDKKLAEEEAGKEESKVQAKELNHHVDHHSSTKSFNEENNNTASETTQRKPECSDCASDSYSDSDKNSSQKNIESESRGPPVIVQAMAELGIQRSWLGDAWDAVGDAVNGAVEWAEDQINEAKEWILEQIRDFVQGIPGYRILTLILEEDPITGARVARTGENMLEAGLDILPLGSVFREVLIRTETYRDAANFVESRVGDFVSLASGISGSFSRFIDSLSLSDIGDPQGVFNRVANLLHDVITSIVGFITRSATEFLEMIKRIMIRLVVNFVRGRIPRLWPLLTVALGHDPITDEVVPRNGTNILNALFEVTDAGREQRRQLQATGTFQKVADWIDRGILVFTNLYIAIRTGFSLIWSLVSIESLADPIGTFEQIYNHFAQPVIDVWNFVADTARIIIQFIKEALLSRLSNWAKDQRGYFLITLLIGRDPFTDQRVPFTVENVIHAFMSLMEGGEEQFQQMKQSGAIDRAVNRVTAAVRRLNFTVEYIVGLFTGLWESLQLSDLANPPALFRRVFNTFADPVRRLVAFVVEIVKIVVEIILQIMQFPTDLVANIINRAMAAWNSIKRDPIGFLKNLLRAIKQGFIQFFDRILDHLLFGLTGWLMSELRDAGVPTLEDFSLRGVISWILTVLNISIEAIWAKLAAHPRIGPERVARIRSLIGRLEGIWTFIRDVQERGITAVWEKIQEQLSNLWSIVLDAVKNWIMREIIEKITVRLLSMLDPTGIMAVINSAIAIYRAIQSFMRYLREMLQVVNSFVEGLVEIAAGNITIAANFLEGTMRRAMPIVIGFLANQVGLSGIGRRIGELVGRARELVDQALTWLVNRAVDTGFALFERLMAMGRSAVGAIAGWLGLRKPFRDLAGGNHEIYFHGSGAAAQLYVASYNPRTIHTLLTAAGQVINRPANRAHQASYDDAVRLNDEVTTIKGRLANPASTTADADNQSMNQKLETLATKLPPLMTMVGGTEPPPLVKPGFTNGPKASSFEVNYLKTGRTSGGTTADTNSGATLIGWPRLSTSGLTARSAWVKMHLLTEQLGGPALDSNLTPARGTETNLLAYREVERHAIDAVAAGHTIWYKITISYHGGADVDYPNHIKIEFGPYDVNAETNQWERKDAGTQVNGQAVGTQSFEQNPAAPDFSGAAVIPNINDPLVGRRRIQSLTAGLDRPFAEFVVEARAHGPFTQATMATQLNNAYNNRTYEIINFPQQVARLTAVAGTAFTF